MCVIFLSLYLVHELYVLNRRIIQYFLCAAAISPNESSAFKET